MSGNAVSQKHATSGAKQQSALASDSAANQGGKSTAYGAGQDAAGWDTVKSKKQIKREKQQQRKEEAQEAERKAKETEKEGCAKMEVEAGETAVPKKWNVDVEGHFKSIKRPNPPHTRNAKLRKLHYKRSYPKPRRRQKL